MGQNVRLARENGEQSSRKGREKDEEECLD